LLVVAVVVFLVLYLRGLDWHAVRSTRVHWPTVAVASVVGLAFRYVGVLVWRTILVDLGADRLPPFTTLADIYAKAWMARYIPGTVTWIAGKVYLASQHGISKSRLAVASLVEAGMQLTALTAVSLLLIGLGPRVAAIPVGLDIFLAVFGAVLLALLSPVCFNAVVRRGYRLVFRREGGAELRTNRKALIHSFGLYAVGGLVSGTSYFLMTDAIWAGTSWHDYAYLVGAFNLAGVVGMAALFVPSGIGVRESVQLLLLTVLMPKETALLITVVTRLWSVAVDVGFVALASATARIERRRDLREPSRGHRSDQ
jgi:uncharacterized membrane protein YbhN (UPF0104 family)